MESSELISLWPLVAAILTPALGFVLGLVGFMHRDSIKTRDLIGRTQTGLLERIERSEAGLRERIERSNKETREDCARQIESATSKLSAEFAEHKRITEENHQSTQRQLERIDDSLKDTRERLSRIEGHLSVSPDSGDLDEHPQEPEADD